MKLFEYIDSFIYGLSLMFISIVFYLFITPIAIILRIFQVDVLNFQFSNAKSYRKISGK